MVAIDGFQVLDPARGIFSYFDEFIADGAPLVLTLDHDIVNVGADLKIIAEFAIELADKFKVEVFNRGELSTLRDVKVLSHQSELVKSACL